MARKTFVLASAAAYPEQCYTQREVVEAVARHNNFSQGRFACPTAKHQLPPFPTCVVPMPSCTSKA